MTDFNFVSHLKPRFPLGQVVMTANVLSRIEPDDIDVGLSRHARCDWGDLPPDGGKENESALWGGGRLLSVYHDRNDVTFWVITETNRRTTTVLLPADY